jgi:hypothetical protein
MSRQIRLVKTFSRAYEAASPEDQAAFWLWMPNIIRPQKELRVDVAKARKFEYRGKGSPDP